ncbi:hypothetical protein DM860_016600 [Cuscuta australis]|uniref:Uncharacterized protein n=1 Tax=Cuscuta australis TaxID=267555 RepID=A0A328DNB1_9ASTE|nr:hypothetical protein DM860_016600 [Cuscuta australis]
MAPASFNHQCRHAPALEEHAQTRGRKWCEIRKFKLQLQQLRRGLSGAAASISNRREGARSGVSRLSSRRRQGLQVTPLVAGSRRRLWTTGTAIPLAAVKSRAVTKSEVAVVDPCWSSRPYGCCRWVVWLEQEQMPVGGRQLAPRMTDLQQIYGVALLPCFEAGGGLPCANGRSKD